MSKIIEDINYYFKNIGKGRLAVDFDKLDKVDVPTILIITERETRVKTFGAKKLIYEKWDKKNPNTLWLRNLVDDLKDEKDAWCSDIPDEMKDEDFEIINNRIINKEKRTLGLLQAVSTPRGRRGSRILLKYVVWDEFNIGIDGRNYNKIVPNFIDLLASTGNTETNKNRKIFLLGNNRSFNHPFLINMGISSIDKEVTVVNDKNGKPLLLILFPIITDKEIASIEKSKEDDVVFQLAKNLGEAEHTYFNKSMLDDVNGVVKKFSPLENNTTELFPDTSGYKLQSTFYVNGSHLNFYWVPPDKREIVLEKQKDGSFKERKIPFHVLDVELFIKEMDKVGIKLILENITTSDKLVCDKKDVGDKRILLNSLQQRQLLLDVIEDKIRYENVASKNKWYQLIKAK